MYVKHAAPGILKAEKSKINAIVEMQPPNDILGCRPSLAKSLISARANLQANLERC